jgi:uncharacterized surface protein with fasciclin (FAS1) repeats
MHTRRLILLIVVAVAALAACGGAPAPQSRGSPMTAPAASSGAPTARIAPTAMTAPIAAIAPTMATSSTAPNDATQARLRVSNCVMGGPTVDVFVNGAVAVNGGMPQANMIALNISGYLYLVPGTYSVAVVPTGKGLAQAILDPLDVPVAAGHRYTVVMLGQVGDAHHTPLVIDETEAYRKAGASPTANGHITVNNIKGAAGLSFLQDGVGEKDVPYGGFAATAPPAMTYKDFTISVSGSGALNTAIEQNGAGFTQPGADALDCFSGSYPGPHDTHTSASTSALNAIEYLQGFSGKNIKVNDASWSFDTFLAAIKTAGLTDLLTHGGPYLLFPPTDSAFAALPKATRDALLADPKALADLIRSHIVAGYYPHGSLAGTPGGNVDRTVTNLLGAKLVLLGGEAGSETGMSINGEDVDPQDGVFVANGIRIEPITKVLLPATK